MKDLDGKESRPLAASSERKATALIFYLSDCPICNALAPEIERLRRDYVSKNAEILLVVVNPNSSADKVREHCRAFKLSSRALIDPDLKLAEAVSAKRTPEAVLLDAEGKVRYRGRINDLYAALGRKRVEPTKHDLREALDAVLAGKTVAVPETEAIGCNLPEKSSSEKKKE